MQHFEYAEAYPPTLGGKISVRGAADGSLPTAISISVSETTPLRALLLALSSKTVVIESFLILAGFLSVFLVRSVFGRYVRPIATTRELRPTQAFLCPA